MPDDEPRTVLVDAMGLLCPVPVLMVSRAAEEAAPGDRVVVVGDDPDIPGDIRAWCEARGARLVRIDESEGVTRAVVEIVAGGEGGSGEGP